ncbi:MAG: sigma-70 family RNA polymerase sigma factor [Firmicutes bacterium]|nr:sigma-70 family RNA polymerase sigma factor [Bacillota bacterium]
MNYDLLKEYCLTKDVNLKKTIVQENIGLVYFVINKFLKKNSLLEEDDLFQIGVIGLIKSLDKFEIDKNTNFSSYAIKYIFGYVIYNLMKDGINGLKAPKKFIKELNVYRQKKSELMAEFGELSYEDIAHYLKIDLKKIMLYETYLKPLIYLNDVDKESEEQYISLIPSQYDLVEEVERKELKFCVKQAIDLVLTEKEKLVIIYRFGLNNNRTLSYEEIGKILGFSRENARLIERKALDKLKDSNLDIYYEMLYGLKVKKSKLDGIEDEYSWEFIKKAIFCLSEKEQVFLNEIFDNDFNGELRQLNEKEKNKYRKIINKLRIILKRLVKEENNNIRKRKINQDKHINLIGN